MGWFKDRFGKKPRKLTHVVTNFVAEQDGPSERDLKVRIVELFHHEPAVERAYLALAEYGDGTGAHVTLAIKCSYGEDQALVRKLMSIFGEMFSAHEHLDIIFVRPDQEHQLRDVCAPFYQLNG
jgi:hypothetical protein